MGALQRYRMRFLLCCFLSVCIMHLTANDTEQAGQTLSDDTKSKTEAEDPASASEKKSNNQKTVDQEDEQPLGNKDAQKSRETPEEVSVNEIWNKLSQRTEGTEYLNAEFIELRKCLTNYRALHPNSPHIILILERVADSLPIFCRGTSEQVALTVIDLVALLEHVNWNIRVKLASIITGILHLCFKSPSGSSFAQVLNEFHHPLIRATVLHRKDILDEELMFENFLILTESFRQDNGQNLQLDDLIRSNFWMISSMEQKLRNHIEYRSSTNSSRFIKIIEGHISLVAMKRLFLLRALEICSLHNESKSLFERALNERIDFDHKYLKFLRYVDFGETLESYYNFWVDEKSNPLVGKWLDSLFPEFASTISLISNDYFRIRAAKYGLQICVNEKLDDVVKVSGISNQLCTFYLSLADGFIEIFLYAPEQKEQLKLANKDGITYLMGSEEQETSSKFHLRAIGKVSSAYMFFVETSMGLQPVNFLPTSRDANSEIQVEDVAVYFERVNLQDIDVRNSKLNYSCGMSTYKGVTLSVLSESQVFESWNDVTSEKQCCGMCQNRLNCAIWSWKADIKRCYLMNSVSIFQKKEGWFTGIPEKSYSVVEHKGLILNSSFLLGDANASSYRACKSSCMPHEMSDDCTAFVWHKEQKTCQLYSSMVGAKTGEAKTLSGEIARDHHFTPLDALDIAATYFGCLRDPGDIICEHLPGNSPGHCFSHCSVTDQTTNAAIALQGQNCCCNQLIKFAAFEKKTDDITCDLTCPAFENGVHCGSDTEFNERYSVYSKKSAFLSYVGCFQDAARSFDCVDMQETLSTENSLVQCAIICSAKTAEFIGLNGQLCCCAFHIGNSETQNEAECTTKCKDNNNCGNLSSEFISVYSFEPLSLKYAGCYNGPSGSNCYQLNSNKLGQCARVCSWSGKNSVGVSGDTCCCGDLKNFKSSGKVSQDKCTEESDNCSIDLEYACDEETFFSVYILNWPDLSDNFCVPHHNMM